MSLWFGSAMGCGVPSGPGCPEYVVVNGAGWAASQTYNLTITGPGLTDTAGNTATTDATGAISSTNGSQGFDNETNAQTTAPPVPGTYTVTMGGVTASYLYVEAPPEIDLFVLQDASCTTASTTCIYNIKMYATGFPLDTTLPLTVDWDGSIINTTAMTTDDTGTIPLVIVGQTPALPVPDPTGTATVTFGGVTGTESLGP